ncbi:PREDICTED: bifunctional coenzyme A synthase isoform X1 [Polistes canadensis]|uniref:bifunctional coenzyme A synthase isoform X1 n=2 Tax=Polistes canadensis TaxID=91411 RepID=UPI000718CCB9|nr:PREDICTED: bifunctional coenzyme A synthase isoform X1 [Polistes canadensis]
MLNTGLLILTNPNRISLLLTFVNKHILKTLYIQYLPEQHLFPPENCTLKLHKLPYYAETVANIYKVASQMCYRLDIRILLARLKDPTFAVINTKNPVEIVIFDKIINSKTIDIFIQNCIVNVSRECNYLTFAAKKEDGTHSNVGQCTSIQKMHKSVVLGGTFDRLHNGHKIFLSEAVLYSEEKLTVGITDTNMLTGKLLWELIEPCSKRISKVKEFLEDVDPLVSYDIVPINDMYGPTKEDPTMEMLVVSEETKRGGDKVNSLRLQKNLNELVIHEVKLLFDENRKEHEESKISSSNQRMRLLGTRLGNVINENKTLKPYIIGLVGGIASGKSSVAEELVKLGAGFVNCDKIAHELYLPKTKGFEIIVSQFGRKIVDANGFINRKVLGNIVFNDKKELDKLNKSMWPIILEKAKEKIQNLYSEGYNIILMEAAVLIQANWQNECHEIWTCIIPPEEAIKRIVRRNDLLEDEAEKRIKMQPSNVDLIKEANVVFCTLWDYDFTKEQVQNAWDELTDYISPYVSY